MNDSKKKRILMLLQNYYYPQDLRVWDEAKTLISAGYDVSVIAPSSTGQPRHEIVNGAHVYRFPAPPFASGILGYVIEYGYSMASIFVLSLLVWLRAGFDIVHSHHPPDLFVFITAFYKLCGKRIMLDHHDLAPELYNARFLGRGNWLFYQLLIWLEKSACRHADHIIATNESYKDIEIRRGNVPEHRITIVRNGPNLNDLRPVDPDPVLKSKGTTIIGYVGVTGTQDGVDYLLRALRHLVFDLNRKDFCCVIVGDGNSLSKLKVLAKRLNIEEYVLFTGWVEKQSDVARYICSMDICVAPEPHDPYNTRSTAVKIMEYMAFGKPIIAFDLPENRFSARAAAIYAVPNDEFDYAQKMNLLMNDPRRRMEMGRIGRKRIEEELSWQHQSKYLLEAYESLVQ